MSRIIAPRRDLVLPQRHTQRGFIINPYAFGGGGGGGGGGDCDPFTPPGPFGGTYSVSQEATSTAATGAEFKVCEPITGA